MEAGRFGLAHQHLVGLADRWPDDGEVLLLLGECEMERGRRDAASASELDRDAAAEFRRGREAAMTAWARVPAASPYFYRAALLRATELMNLGQYVSAEEIKYALAEEILINALASGRPNPVDRYELERALSRLYRWEGRMDDVQRVLRASWCRSPDPAGVLRELWLLDYSPMPVEAWQERALDKADNEDDRVWLGRANHAILTGRFADAGAWLDRALERRPKDSAVWRAKLALARATDDVPGLRMAASRLPGDSFPAGMVYSLRAWLAGRLGQAEVERRELAYLIRDVPGDARAIERLAVLTFQAGQATESEKLRHRKAEVDRAQDRVRRVPARCPTPSRACRGTGPALPHARP